MNPKEYLESIKIQDRKVKNMRLKLRMLREALDIKGVSYESDGSVLSSHPTTTMADAIAKLIDYENKLKEEEAKLTISIYNAEMAIQQLDSLQEREVLERIFLFFEPLDKIMEEMSYSKSSIYSFRDKGLQKITISESLG